MPKRSAIYYIRPNKTDKLPTNILILDTETKGETVEDAAIHTMYMAWTWRFTLGPKGEIQREKWTFWDDGQLLGEYVDQEARPKAPLYIIGSNITFDLFASGLASFLHGTTWRAEMLYDKGMVTIIVLKDGDRTIKFLALQNFLDGGVAEWGKLLGLQKQEVDFDKDTFTTIKEYCRIDTEITGRAFIGYLDFVRKHDMGGFAVTKSGQSFRCFRHRFMKEKILHYDETKFNNFTRNGYYGGRVECGHIGTREGGTYVKVDVNSMYPAIMQRQYFPTVLRQWIKEPDHEYALRQLRSYCCMGRVTLQTDEPVYPVRIPGKLVFPVGEFQTILSTESLRYAFKHGHIKSVHELLTFRRAKLFAAFVDEFYSLRLRYKKEKNAVWEKTVKLMLNSLYGKFGEKRERELHRLPDPEGEFYRGEYSLWLNPDSEMVEHLPEEKRQEAKSKGVFINGMEWKAFGTSCVTWGEKEGPQSAPFIAAHVTDYGRMLLWKFIKMVGHKNVLYADTDSLIIEAKHLPKLKGVINEAKLGSLKVEGTTDRLEIRGAKDYTFGKEIRRKGVRANSVKEADGSFTMPYFPGLYSLQRRGIVDGFPIGSVNKRLTLIYDKGLVGEDGTVTPIVLPR